MLVAIILVILLFGFGHHHAGVLIRSGLCGWRGVVMRGCSGRM